LKNKLREARQQDLTKPSRGEAVSQGHFVNKNKRYGAKDLELTQSYQVLSWVVHVLIAVCCQVGYVLETVIAWQRVVGEGCRFVQPKRQT